MRADEYFSCGTKVRAMLDEEGKEEKELEVQVLGSKVIKNRKVREITLSSRNYKPFSIRNKDGSVVLKWDVFEA